jgi:hypothetical protein
MVYAVDVPLDVSGYVFHESRFYLYYPQFLNLASPITQLGYREIITVNQC